MKVTEEVRNKFAEKSDSNIVVSAGSCLCHIVKKITTRGGIRPYTVFWMKKWMYSGFLMTFEESSKFRFIHFIKLITL